MKNHPPLSVIPLSGGSRATSVLPRRLRQRGVRLRSLIIILSFSRLRLMASSSVSPLSTDTYLYPFGKLVT